MPFMLLMASLGCGPGRPAPSAEPPHPSVPSDAPQPAPAADASRPAPTDAAGNETPSATATEAASDFCGREYDRMDDCVPDEMRHRMPTKADYVAKCSAETARLKAAGNYNEAWETSAEQCLELDDCGALDACMMKLGMSRSLEDERPPAQ